MQKRTIIAGRPYWVGVYQEDNGEWLAIGEIRGQSIVIAAATERKAIEAWQKEAEARLSEA